MQHLPRITWNQWIQFGEDRLLSLNCNVHIALICRTAINEGRRLAERMDAKTGAATRNGQPFSVTCTLFIFLYPTFVATNTCWLTGNLPWRSKPNWIDLICHSIGPFPHWRYFKLTFPPFCPTVDSTKGSIDSSNVRHCVLQCVEFDTITSKSIVRRDSTCAAFLRQCCCSVQLSVQCKSMWKYLANRERSRQWRWSEPRNGFN